MDSDQGKLFIGGIPWETSDEKLKEYFGKYGEVVQAVVMRDKTTGRPRGFGFVVFSDPSVLDAVLHEEHIIDGRTVEAKRALSREEQHSTSRTGNSNANSGAGSSGVYFKTKKIFVGGLPSTLTEKEFRQYFESYGHVTDVVIIYDQNTQRPRGFGFISFDTEDAVDGVLHKTFHELNGKQVEVKRALPKDSNSSNGTHFGVYQNSIGGFPTYSGYGPLGYGYAAAGNSIGYGGYGVGGYGGSNAVPYLNLNQMASMFGALGCLPVPTGQSLSGVPQRLGYGYGGYGGSEGFYANYGGYGAISVGSYINPLQAAAAAGGGGYGGAQFKQVQQQ